MIAETAERDFSGEEFLSGEGEGSADGKKKNTRGRLFGKRKGGKVVGGGGKGEWLSGHTGGPAWGGGGRIDSWERPRRWKGLGQLGALGKKGGGPLSPEWLGKMRSRNLDCGADQISNQKKTRRGGSKGSEKENEIINREHKNIRKQEKKKKTKPKNTTPQ